MKPKDPETERKRAWLNRYRESIVTQKHLAEALQELRSRATSISAPLTGARSAPTGSHADRVADSVQRIAAAEQRLQAEQERGETIAAEIITVLFDQLTTAQAQALVYQYIDGLTADQTADKIFREPSTVMRHRSMGVAALQLPENVL